VSSAWLRQTNHGVVLALHIQPGAKNTEIAGEHGDALKIRLAAPPVDGKANECLIEFIAELIRLPKSSVRLLSGHGSRKKRIEIVGMGVDEVSNRLSP
jgi:uncharacterized protein (TIGR00251 family)